MTIPCFTHLSMSLWYLFRCYTTPQYKPVFVIKGQRIKQQWHHSSHLSALVPEELASVLYDLFVRQQTVGLLLTQGEDLPQGDTKRPHVAGCGELTLVEKMEPFKILICNLQLKISYWFKKKKSWITVLSNSPAGCSPRPSSVWGAPPGLGCGSSRCCTGFGSSRNQRFWWWGVGPAGSSWSPGHDAQSSETPGISSLRRSAPPCGGGQTDWRDEGRRRVLPR